MKRSILRIFLLALTALALLAPTALAEQWPVGVWELTDMKHGNSLISSINMQTKIVLYADGTATLTEIMTSTGKWTASGTKLTILFGDSRLKRSFEYQEDGRLLEIKEIYGFGNVSNLAYYYYTRTGDVPTKPTKVNFYEDGPLTLSIGDTLTLGFYFEPGNADSTVKWSTSKYNVVWVDQKGVVTAYNEGTATITVKTDNGKKDTIKIKVVDPYKPTKVELDKSGTVTLNMGDTLQLNTAFQPETAKTTLKWTTSSKKVATVDENGVVTPVKEGTATITVKTANGKKDTVKVKVVDPYNPSKIVLDKSGTVTLSMGETLTLGYTLSPETAKTTAKWTTSSKKVATVDENGVVTPVKEGTATITVKTHNGKKDTVKVKVVDPFKATAIKAASKLTLTEGDTVSPEYTLVPATATSTVKATSSNKKVLKVNADGTVTALKKGSATLTLKTSSGKSCKIKVTVQAKPDKEEKPSTGEYPMAELYKMCEIAIVEYEEKGSYETWEQIANAIADGRITREQTAILAETYGFRFTDRMDELGVPY